MTISVKKLNVAILDDYQNVSHHFANWYKLSDKIEVDVLNEYIGREENLSNILSTDKQNSSKKCYFFGTFRQKWQPSFK